MPLIDTYLTQVSQHLPGADRQDILEELRSVIEAQVNDLAAQHNRAPATADEAQVLSQFGHPIKVASSYLRQQYLIGPELFPAYRQVLRNALLIVLLVQAVISILQALGSGSPVFAGLISQLLNTAFWVAATVTGVFALLEYSGERLGWYDQWQASSLRSNAAINRGDLITNLLTELVFLLWWNQLIGFGQWLTENAQDGWVTLGATWQSLYWPLNALVGALAVLHLLVLISGAWTRTALRIEITCNLAVVALGCWLLQQPELLLFDTVDFTTQLERNIDRALRVALIVIVGFSAWDTWLAWRRAGSLSNQAPH